MTPVYFILIGQEVQQADFYAWEQWFQSVKPDNLIVKHTRIEPDTAISTVFISIDLYPKHGKGSKIFKTQVSGGILDGLKVYESTWQGAVVQHDSIARVVKVATIHHEDIVNETNKQS